MSFEAIDKKAIAHSFGEAAPRYDSVAHFQRFVGEELLSRLPYSKPVSILDLGTGTGYFLKSLQDLNKESELVAADLSEGMLQFIQENYFSGQDKLDVGLIACDAENLPFGAQSFDLVFSSLAVQWCYDLPKLFSEIFRILKPKGVFAYSTLLEGSLFELKQSWQQVDQAQHVNDFFDAKEYDAAANKTGLSHELQQVEKQIYYEQAIDLSKELKVLGAHNVTPRRNKGLTGKARLKAFINEYERYRQPDGKLPATYQVGYGICTK